MIRDLIIDKINKIKSEEEDFKSYWWKENFVSYTKIVRKLPLSSHTPIDVTENITTHVSEVDFDEIIDEDLIRLFEYIIVTKCDISYKRIQKTYFSEHDLKSNL